MRYLAILCVIVVAYLVFVHSKATPPSPTSSVQTAATPAQASMIKAPIDKARKALEATEKRNSEGF